MRRFVLSLLALFLMAPSLIAQEVPGVEIFGGYSYLNVDSTGLTNRLNFNGFETNITVNVNRHLGIEVDFAHQFQSPCDQGIGIQFNNRCADQALMAGPKVSFRNKRFNPFAHLLFGRDTFSVTNPSGGGLTTSLTGWAMAAGAGLDIAVSRRISVRVGQFDYFMTNHNGIIGNFSNPGRQNHVRTSTGVVFKLGHP